MTSHCLLHTVHKSAPCDKTDATRPVTSSSTAPSTLNPSRRGLSLDLSLDSSHNAPWERIFFFRVSYSQTVQAVRSSFTMHMRRSSSASAVLSTTHTIRGRPALSRELIASSKTRSHEARPRSPNPIATSIGLCKRSHRSPWHAPYQLSSSRPPQLAHKPT